MGIISSEKSIGGVTVLGCDGTLEVTLGLTAAPDIMSNPTDIVLVLDRSGSMAGQPLADLKTAVDTFIEIIAQSTGGAPDQIGSGSRIGIVSFARTATNDTGLITSVQELNEATADLVAGGNTNHGDAFATATALLSGSTNAKVIVMFTDGVTTTGPDPDPLAAAAKAQGITIFCIGLVGDTGIDADRLRLWASDPDITHVAIAPTSAELEEIFAELAANISIPGATGIVINETINPDFTIVGAPVASKGTISLLTATSFRWSIGSLGTTATESTTVTFTIQHTAGTTGLKHVNESITYFDEEGNTVSFDDPTVFVDCTPGIPADPCPTPVDITIPGCEDFVEVDAGDITPSGLGRIVELEVTIRNVCPGRRVALAVLLNEVDAEGTEFARGLKTYTIPAQPGPGCSDVLVRCIRFVLPEDLRPTGPTDQLCPGRELQAQFFTNYIDTDFQCCRAQTI